MESLNALENLKTVKDKQVDITRVVYAVIVRWTWFITIRRKILIIVHQMWIRREYYADANPIFEHDLSLYMHFHLSYKVFEVPYQKMMLMT